MRKRWIGLALIPIAVLVFSFLFIQTANGAITESVTLDVLNTSVGINQNLFLNFSAFSYNSSNYSLSMNGKVISSGIVPKDYLKPTQVSYNVTNTPYGQYKICLSESILKEPLCSNTTVSILPFPSFSFDGTKTNVFVFNGTAEENLIIFDDGNTPLNMTWSLPVVKGISLSIQELHETFQMSPNQTVTIPVNISTTLTNATLSFPFQAEFDGQTLNKTVTLSLLHPVISIKFPTNGSVNETDNYTYYTIKFQNGNNVPVVMNFKFLLYVDGNPLTYNITEAIQPGQDSITVKLPKGATVSKVEVFYPSSSGTTINQTLFFKPVSPAITISGYSSSTILYIILTIVVIVMLFLVYYINIRRKK